MLTLEAAEKISGGDGKLERGVDGLFGVFQEKFSADMLLSEKILEATIHALK